MEKMTFFQIFFELVKTLPSMFLLYITTIVFSVPLGILGALSYTGKNKIIKFLISTYTWIFRGTPLMLQLLMVYYGLPLIKRPITTPQKASGMASMMRNGSKKLS